MNAPELDLQAIRVRTFTRWVDDGSKHLPRELVVEVRGHATSLDDAVAKFANVARPIATMVGFVANVRVGPLEVLLAYAWAPTGQEREFLQTFIADERGALTEGRIIQTRLLEAACLAYITVPTDSARISRALRHYELALRDWYIGGEWLALNHLWIAAENLTKAVIRKIVAATGKSEEDLAHDHGLATDDPQRPRWKALLGARIREKVIFRGDTETYKAANDASNGLEHGIWELDRIAKQAIMCADKTFQYIRRTIIGLLDVPATLADELNNIALKDVQSMRKVVRGQLTGTAEDPALEGERYPRLEWSTGTESVVREGSAFRMRQRERMTVRVHPDVGFRLERLEVHGRLENGQAPIQVSGEEVSVDHTPGSPVSTLLESVMPLVEQATASGEYARHTQASMFAFNMFGQAVAFFQSIHVLVGARQPVEALPALRGLGILSARFEQMDAPDGPCLGVAVRGVLDALANFGADAELVETRQREILTVAQAQAVVVPAELVGPETTAICRSLEMEMKFATWAADGTYGTAGLHLQRVDSEHLGFHVTLDPGPLTELVATAAVIAMLQLLGHAVSLFGWNLEHDQLNQLLGQARAVNESAAQLHLFPAGSGDLGTDSG